MPTGTSVDLKLLITATDKTQRVVSRVQRGVNELSRGVQELGRKSAKGTRQTTHGFKEIGKSVDTTSKKVEKFTKSLEGIGTAGTALMGVAASLSATAFFPIWSATQFEAAMSQVVAVTTGAEEKFQELKATAGELGRTTKFTATQAAQGMVFLGQAGFEASQVLSGIAPSLQLAVAAGVDLATAADIASNIVSAMRLEVEELGIATDVLANTTASANTNLLQLADAMKYAGPLAAASNISLEELAAVMGVLGNNGIQASMAGTAVRGMLRALTAPTSTARDKLKELGVYIEQSADGSLNLVKALEDLAKANLTAADANAIFGRFASAGALAVTANVEELHKLIASNNAAAGAADRMASIMKDNVKGSFVELLSALDGFKRAIGDPLLGPLRSLIKVSTSFISQLTAIAEEIPTTIQLFGAFSAVTVVLAGAVGGLALAVGSLNFMLSALQRTGVISVLLKMKSAWLTLSTYVGYALLSVKDFIFALGQLKAVLIGPLLTAIKAVIATISGSLILTIGSAVVAIGAIVLVIHELVSNFQRGTEEAGRLGQEIHALNRTFDRQIEKLEKLEKGSDAYVATAKAMRNQLLDVADSTEELEEEATAAANSINEFTGEIIDSGKALEKFQQKTRDIALENMSKNVQGLSQRLDRLNGDLKDSIYWWGKFIQVLKIVRTVLPIYTLRELREEQDALKTSTENLLKASARSAIGMAKAYGELNENMDPAAVSAYFKVFRGLDDTSAARVSSAYADLQKETEKTKKETEALNDLSLNELNQKVRESVSEVSKFSQAYDEARREREKTVAAFNKLTVEEQENNEAAVETVKRVFRAEQKAYADRLHADNVFSNALIQNRSRVLNDVEDSYREEEKAIKRRADLGYEAEWQTQQKLKNLEVKRLEERKAGLVALTKLAFEQGTARVEDYQSLLQEVTDIEEQITEARKQAGDERIKHANSVRQKILQMEREAAEIRISLQADPIKRRQAQLDLELKFMDEEAKRLGIHLDKLNSIKIEKTKQANAEIKRLQEEQDLRIQSARIDGANTVLEAELDQIEKNFEKRRISAEEYSNESYRIQQELIANELALLNAKLEVEQARLDGSPLVVELEVKIERLEEQKERLEKDQPETLKKAKLKEKQLALQIDQEIADQELDILELSNDALQDRMDKKLEIRRNQLEQELIAMEIAGATKEELERKHWMNEKQLALERNKELRDIEQLRLAQMQQVLYQMEDTFSELYEASGKKRKEFLYLEKAAAIARIIMSTQVAIMKAYEQMGPIGGGVMAALLSAKMVTSIAKVTSAASGSNYAEGGEVKGKSPHKRADNIPAWLTAKEFVHPVDTVKYYGKNVMEGLRQRIIPRELFEGYRLPVLQPVGVPRRHFASGGEVTPRREKTYGKSKTDPVVAPPQPITILNVTDPAEMDRYLSTSQGQGAIMNVISSKSETVKRILK